MRIRKLLRVRFVVYSFTEQEKIMAELTPMMQKYMETKEQYKDCILFYRLGDFYEMFFDDAIVASKELEIALTGKSCGLEERAPMCGIPYHAVETYLASGGSFLPKKCQKFPADRVGFSPEFQKSNTFFR